MFRRARLPYDLRLILWKDGYRMAKEKQGVGLFSTTRTKKRESLFHWIGPLDSQYLGLFAKKEAGLKMKNIEDAKKVHRIGTYKDDVMEQLLLEKGFKNLESVSSQVLNLKKLMAGRIDMVGSEKLEFVLLAQKEGVDPDEFEFIYSLDKSDLYLVFSKSTPLSLVNKLNKVFDGMKQDGFLKRTTQKWYHN
jgi:polar amino acid transport system substrate-binding protein